MHHHKYSITEIEQMVPWEREVYITLLVDYIKKETFLKLEQLSDEVGKILTGYSNAIKNN